MPLRTSKTRVLALLAVLVVALLGVGCSSGSSEASGTGSSGSCAAVGTSFTLVAKNIAWKDTKGGPVKCLSAKKGASVTFTVDNEDTVQHNLHITGNGVDETTPLRSGPVKQTLKVAFAKAGSYTFVCDIHPNMEGKLTVS